VTHEHAFGKEVGGYFQRVLEEHGVDIHGGQEVERFEGSDGQVGKVVTKSGLELEADFVVVGIGVQPDVTLARSAGLELGDAGGVKCSSRLESSVSGIYAAGDICEYDSPIHGRPMRIEHWDVAFNQGKTAGLNMLGRDRPHDVVPYFYSDLADWASMEYVGPAMRWDREVVRGSLESGEFSVFYADAGRVVAAISVGRPEDLDVARRLIRGHGSADEL
jgi:3-phenylpropionate/trans-cinnamate dioxygenase ferredoxin reductase subunit